MEINGVLFIDFIEAIIAKWEDEECTTKEQKA